jgi:PST family polysaccharide transporter
MAGVAGINMFLGMVRVKLSAVMIGVQGTGMVSGYNSVQGLLGTIAGLGIQSSAVREIALIAAKEDDHAVGRIIVILNRISLLTGILGFLSMVALSPVISQLTFGNRDYILDISALGLTILLNNLAMGRMALLHGLRKINDMAKANVLGTSIATVFTVAFYYWFGIRGIVPSFIAISLIQLCVAFIYSRKITFERVKITWRCTLKESRGMVQLGFVFMLNSLVASAVGFATIAIISQKLSVQAIGIYSAAMALSGVFINFILSSMGTDYYPRLASMSGDMQGMNKLANEQTEICLLLSLPGLIGTLTLAPWAIKLFYSSEFLASTDLLRWFILGCFGRIVSWPLGFLILALGQKKYLLINESTFHILHLILIYLSIDYFGILGVSVAFFVLYIGYTVSVYLISKKLVQFKWDPGTRGKLVYSTLVLVGCFICTKALPLWASTIIGLVVTLGSLYYSIRWLISNISATNPLVKRILDLRIVTFLFSTR